MLCRSCRRLLSRGAAYCGSCGRAVDAATAPLEIVLRDGTRVPLVATVTIGRAPGNTIRLADPSVSRYHARIVADGHGVQLEDAGSSHGTLRDGQPLAGRQEVRDGMRIQLGDSLLRIEHPRDEAEAGRTIVVRPGATLAVPATGQPLLTAGGAISGLHPRVRPGWALKRLPAGEGERRYVLRELRGGRFLNLGADEAALFELLDGRAALPELIADAERRLGSHGPTRLACLLAELGERGLLEGVEPAAVIGPPRGRLSRLLRPRERAIGAAPAIFERLYRRGGFLLFTPVVLFALTAVGMLGLAAFVYLIAGHYGTPFVVAERVELGAAVFLLGRFVLAALHELAHALTIASFGRRVPRAGIKLMFLIPYSFVETSESWFEPRRRRLAIAAAGPAGDLVLAGSFAIVAALLASGSLRDIFFQLAFAGYLGALLNLNPAIPGRDGYPLLLDLLRSPDVRRRAHEWLAGRPVTPADRKAAKTYLSAAVTWLLAAAALTIIISSRYYERLAALVPEAVVWLVLGLFYLVLLIPVALLIGRPLAERWRRAPPGDANAVG